jgi:hypothetical protein
LQRINTDAKIITLGDLNDGPFNNSVKKSIRAKANKADVPPLEYYNPLKKWLRFRNHCFRDSWDIFDQIMVSQTLKMIFSSYRY